MRGARILLIPFLLALTACSGDDDPFRCVLDDNIKPVTTDWPSARKDPFNSGRVTATLSNSPLGAECIFPIATGSEECTTGPAITTTALLLPLQEEQAATPEETPQPALPPEIVVATSEGNVHLLALDGTERPLAEPIRLNTSVTTPLFTADGSISVGSNTGVLRRFSRTDGDQLAATTLPNSIEAPLNIGPEGVIYASSISGVLRGVCSNGNFRSQFLAGRISSPAAIVTDPADSERTLIIAAAESGRVAALEDQRGDLVWSLFAAAPIVRAAVVVDIDQNAPLQKFIVADITGRVVAGSIETGDPFRRPYRAARCLPVGTTSIACGEPMVECEPEQACVGERITASPALGTDAVYIATEGASNDRQTERSSGALYAFSTEFDGDEAEWIWFAPNNGTIQSSPIVVTANGEPDIVIVAVDIDCTDDDSCACTEERCDRSAVFAVQDAEVLWRVELPDPVGQAGPSIRLGEDGPEIYIGTEAGQLFKIS